MCARSRSGIEGTRLALIEDAVEKMPKAAGREECFKEGWQKFCAYFAHAQQIDITDGESMNNAIKDIALMFGSSR